MAATSHSNRPTEVTEEWPTVPASMFVSDNLNQPKENNMTGGTIITMTICGLIILAGVVSVGSKAICCYMEINTHRKIEERRRETIELEHEKFKERLSIQFEAMVLPSKI